MRIFALLVFVLKLGDAVKIGRFGKENNDFGYRSLLSSSNDGQYDEHGRRLPPHPPPRRHRSSAPRRRVHPKPPMRDAPTGHRAGFRGSRYPKRNQNRGAYGNHGRNKGYSPKGYIKPMIQYSEDKSGGFGDAYDKKMWDPQHDDGYKTPSWSSFDNDKKDPWDSYGSSKDPWGSVGKSKSSWDPFGNNKKDPWDMLNTKKTPWDRKNPWDKKNPWDVDTKKTAWNSPKNSKKNSYNTPHRGNSRDTWENKKDSWDSKKNPWDTKKDPWEELKKSSWNPFGKKNNKWDDFTQNTDTYGKFSDYTYSSQDKHEKCDYDKQGDETTNTALDDGYMSGTDLLHDSNFRSDNAADNWARKPTNNNEQSPGSSKSSEDEYERGMYYSEPARHPRRSLPVVQYLFPVSARVAFRPQNDRNRYDAYGNRFNGYESPDQFHYRQSYKSRFTRHPPVHQDTTYNRLPSRVNTYQYGGYRQHDLGRARMNARPLDAYNSYTRSNEYQQRQYNAARSRYYQRPNQVQGFAPLSRYARPAAPDRNTPHNYIGSSHDRDMYRRSADNRFSFAGETRLNDRYENRYAGDVYKYNSRRYDDDPFESKYSKHVWLRM